MIHQGRKIIFCLVFSAALAGCGNIGTHIPLQHAIEMTETKPEAFFETAAEAEEAPGKADISSMEATGTEATGAETTGIEATGAGVTGAGATGAEATGAETTGNEATGAETEIGIPTEFQVFTDGQPHYLMFYADKEGLYWSSFTSVSRPDLGIASISFLSAMTDVEEANLLTIHESGSIRINGETDIIDMTTLPDYGCGYGRRMPGFGEVGIFSVPIEMQGEIPTAQEIAGIDAVKSMSWLSTEVYRDISAEGYTLYSVYCTIPYTEEEAYEGALFFRIRDGRAEGAYIALLEENESIKAGFIHYTMQSLRFDETIVPS